MSKKLQFIYGGKEYTLEFTRRTVEQMERKGFVASELTEKPMSCLPDLFAGAFLANHRFLKRDVIDEIYDKLTNKQELVGKLAEMYNEPIESLFDEPEENEGNVNWTATF